MPRRQWLDTRFKIPPEDLVFTPWRSDTILVLEVSAVEENNCSPPPGILMWGPEVVFARPSPHIMTGKIDMVEAINL